MEYDVNCNNTPFGCEVRRVVKSKLSGSLTLSDLDRNCMSGIMVDFCFDQEGDLILKINKEACHQQDFSDQTYLLAIDQENELGMDILISGTSQVHHDQVYSANVYQLYFRDIFVSEYNLFDYFYIKLEVNQVQLIGQEGNIFHLDRSDFIQEQIFSPEQVQETCSYVNQYHQEALRQYCMTIGLPHENQVISVIAFDKEGIWLQVNTKKYFMSFSKTISNLAMFKAILIALAKQYGLFQHHQEY
ncbi:hypothetical protein OAO18_05875 [Francisellaceae bacterium]|nr:hypothetical protein [Francisellaceae bacterium]